MKIWQTDTTASPHQLIEQFTVDKDYEFDRYLLKFDCQASIAHARQLEKIGIIEAGERVQLIEGLREILRQRRSFPITIEQEDCHTAIEAYLTDKLGEPGKKIHTGRSRNDQVLTALRLYEKVNLRRLRFLIHDLQCRLEDLITRDGAIPIPGYTHLQRAMPSTVEQALRAYLFSLEDDKLLLKQVAGLINQNPLGSAAGYGVPLPLDREMTTRLLRFEKTQYTTYAQNSRGKFETIILSALNNLHNSINKIACDWLLYSTVEFGFITLAPEFTTGSSIMPQKRNPDVLELLRGKSKLVAGWALQVDLITKDLYSGYQRDLQLIKEPLIRSFELTVQCLKVLIRLCEGVRFNEEACRKACSPELYLTEKVYQLVMQGMPFRDAYRQIKKNWQEREGK